MSSGRRVGDGPPRLGQLPWELIAERLEEFLQKLWDSNADGVPAGFNGVTPTQITPDSTGDPGDETQGWAAADHDHPITTDTPTDLGNAAAEGTSAAFSRADHVHKRTTRVKANGSDVGTRNAVNFSPDFTVADNGGSDRVDVSLATSPADSEYLSWVL